MYFVKLKTKIVANSIFLKFKLQPNYSFSLSNIEIFTHGACTDLCGTEYFQMTEKLEVSLIFVAKMLLPLH